MHSYLLCTLDCIYTYYFKAIHANPNHAPCVPNLYEPTCQGQPAVLSHQRTHKPHVQTPCPEGGPLGQLLWWSGPPSSELPSAHQRVQPQLQMVGQPMSPHSIIVGCYWLTNLHTCMLTHDKNSQHTHWGWAYKLIQGYHFQEFLCNIKSTLGTVDSELLVQIAHCTLHVITL